MRSSPCHADRRPIAFNLTKCSVLAPREPHRTKPLGRTEQLLLHTANVKEKNLKKITADCIITGMSV